MALKNQRTIVIVVCFLFQPDLTSAWLNLDSGSFLEQLFGLYDFWKSFLILIIALYYPFWFCMNTTLIELSLFVMQKAQSRRRKYYCYNKRWLLFLHWLLFCWKIGPFLLSVHFEGDPMNASRKSVEEMNTDMNKDDQAIWPDRFCSCSSFFVDKYVQANPVFYMCGHL